MRMFTLSIICVALVAPGRLAAQFGDLGKKDRVLTVIGVGTVKHKPEGAKVAFAVRASDNAFATAWKDNQTQTDKLQGALERLKLTGVQIKIAPPEVTQNDLANPAVVLQPMPMAVGALPFNVTRSFQVVVTDKDFPELHKKVLKVMETALTHGANAPATPGNHNAWIGGGFPNNMSITRVEFFSRHDADPRQKAYRMAVEAAVMNARAAAVGAGVEKLGEIVSIREHQDPNLG
ncbi:MAG: SIMPL domain-containing protein, partial [Gemmataceae bacterium]|nr:SIMPL domain-containing protein [Gemmataceae bacterium]